VKERQSSDQSDEWSLGDLSVCVLEEMLLDLMIVKYPGIEQSDIDRLLGALRDSDLSLVSEIEADVAEKSSLWMHAMLDIDD
jgi:hypothetical protein